ncbi:FAD/NAD(P)-binding domain-containing protein [Auriscalpium vulgare]|uniref:FAD/NAD(P)-binding domain-containing protein n=1 Tax=Auriscalpium vulgare TaxID=40419 RepID=A0ACB8R9M0_9AGAM|nr:FAD/NAD(P)-binding domain-containing protein [Auriscalpium vulgare]
MSTPPPPAARTAVVVGAGPVGCLAAMALAKMGWHVDVYESRPDMRLPASKAAAQQRSINLAISSRGIAALQAVDPAATARFMETVIPMRGRMIHDLHGHLDSQLYDRDGQCINSIDRALLNEGLLAEALAVPNVRVFFKHKMLSVDFDQRIMTMHDVGADTDVPIQFDLCVGADGSYSVVRRQLMRAVRMDYSQAYLPHDYIELKMPAGRDDAGDPTFLLDPHHLHIWPRHSFMLIALPNKDKTFTCTLFAPTTEFARLDSAGAITAWFEAQFPDALRLIGEESLLRAFERNPRNPLISIKVNPYHYRDRAIILGDAAHSMVPFYGQGLNCGLEDVRVLSVLLREAGVDPSPLPEGATEDARLAAALARYSASRHEDLVAISDLAMDNYVEMRHAVTTPAYLLRRAVDRLLFAVSSPKAVTLAGLGPVLARVGFPAGAARGWLPLYTMVTFRPDISYGQAKKKAGEQARWLSGAGAGASVAVGMVLTWMALWRRTGQRHVQ